MNINFKKGKLLSGIIYPEFFPIKRTDAVLNIGCGDGVQMIVYEGKFKEMVGIDINLERLKIAEKLANYYHINNWKSINANVEKIPINEKFDKIIAIDIIEHVLQPKKVAAEIYRLLKDNGEVLITFPAMHDKWENLFRFVGRKILRRKSKTVYKKGWDPDQHQCNYGLKMWIGLVENSGLKLVDSRASTLFPPLHYLGVSRFWFANRFIHAIDNYLCKLTVFKKSGQALVCKFRKIN